VPRMVQRYSCHNEGGRKRTNTMGREPAFADPPIVSKRANRTSVHCGCRLRMATVRARSGSE
jgi:hypothetical protein